MKHFLIKYQFRAGSEAQWHQEISRFVAALDSDPDLTGKISYRCMQRRGGSDCYHLATAADETANEMLRNREFFKHYTAQAKLAAGGEVEVVPLDIIAETKYQP